MPEPYEFHFQEGFDGEPAQIILDGKVAASFDLRTRRQIGLAHIEKLTLSPGQSVEIRVGSKRTTLTLGDGSKYIRLNSAGGELTAQQTASMPGYV